jgi:hypothetical protein
MCQTSQLTSSSPINELLPPTVRYGDGDAQPGQYSNNNLEWIDPESSPKDIVFPGTIVIKPKDIAEKEAKNIYKLDRVNLDLIIWSDRSKLEIEGVGTGIALKQGKTWL